MPEYDVFGDLFSKFCAMMWLYLIWKSHNKGEFPLKLRGSNDILLMYTGWRMYVLLGVPFVLMGIPVFLWGMDYSDMMSARETLLTFLLFWSSLIVIPIAWLIATIAQIRANRREKRKRF